MIADCETCDRKQIPCKSCQESQRAICYRCDGDVDDPYCEAGNAGATGKSDILELSKRIETGLKEDDGEFFAPPLSREQWWMIASSLDYAARFDLPTEPQTALPHTPQGRSPADVETPNLPQMRQSDG